MGGQLTVSSIEHRGSTFTFVLPYKVSTSSEHSDDPDELTDMADYDAASDDEVAESYFQFQPRTLGSLFSSNGTSRTQKLLPHKLNGLSQNSYSFPYNNIRQEEMALVENCCSAVTDVAETLSEPESSMSHIPDSNCEAPARKDRHGQDDSNSPSQNSTSDSNHRAQASRENGVAAKMREPQGTCERQEKSDADSECSSGSSSKIPKSTSKPKILLVEDNKINVMVAQSMMKQLGQSLEVVNNGVEAVRAVQRCSYDLILMVYNFYRISKALLVYSNTTILVLVFTFFFAGCPYASYGWPSSYKNNTVFRRNWQLECSFGSWNRTTGAVSQYATKRHLALWKANPNHCGEHFRSQMLYCSIANPIIVLICGRLNLFVWFGCR